MKVREFLQVPLSAVAILAIGGTSWAQSVSDNTTPRAKPQTSQPAPLEDGSSAGGTTFSFDPVSNFFRARQRPLVDHRTFRELERNRFGGDTIDPTGRFDSFFTAPETIPSQRLGQYTR